MAPLGPERGTVKSRASHQSMARHADEIARPRRSGRLAELEKTISEIKKELDSINKTKYSCNSQVQGFKKYLYDNAVRRKEEAEREKGVWTPIMLK